MPKTKISITVESALVEQIDELGVEASRSEIVEKAIESWLRRRKQASLNRAVEAYYQELTNRDREEDAEWASIAADAIGETWK